MVQENNRLSYYQQHSLLVRSSYIFVFTFTSTEFLQILSKSLAFFFSLPIFHSLAFSFIYFFTTSKTITKFIVLKNKVKDYLPDIFLESIFTPFFVINYILYSFQVYSYRRLFTNYFIINYVLSDFQVIYF